MVLGYQSNYGIHVYPDKGGRPVYTGNHGWSRDTRLTLHSPSSMDDMGLYMATLDYPPLATLIRSTHSTIVIHTLNLCKVKSMDDICGEWVECMGVASGRG